MIQTNSMGELDTMIVCKKCGRSITQSIYDRKSDDDYGCDVLALQKWNAGMTQEEVDQIKDEELRRRQLHEDGLLWHPIYSNNMVGNPEDGLYCLIFKKDGEKIYCCKWTIEYQLKESEPMWIAKGGIIEAYILHMKRYFDVKGPLHYPKSRKKPVDYYSDKTKDITLKDLEINDYGEFVRAYKTLEEAKAGALARCGWQGLNRETIIRGEIIR